MHLDKKGIGILEERRAGPWGQASVLGKTTTNGW